MPATRIAFRLPALIALLVALLLLLASTQGGTTAATAALVSQPDHTAAMLWASGWTAISQDQTLTFNHNLNVAPEQLAVELWFLDTAAGGLGIHRANYGGNEIAQPASTWQGAYWRNLTNNTIAVHRMANDQVVDQVSVRVWVAPTPDYDSGWQTLDPVFPGRKKVFAHNLGVTATDLAVAVWFRHPTLGIHQYAYGGLTAGADELGAYWFQLTDSKVSVYSRPDDTWVVEVRVVVTQADPPAYDSLAALGGWQAIAPGTAFTFDHNLSADPNLLLARAECRDIAGSIHQLYAGGDEENGTFRGIHLQRLTANTVQLFRRAGDLGCEGARVVIYERGAGSIFFLPMVNND